MKIEFLWRDVKMYIFRIWNYVEFKDEFLFLQLEIEEKQRAVRRSREAEAERAVKKGLPYEEYKPFWFTKVNDELSGTGFFSTLILGLKFE